MASPNTSTRPSSRRLSLTLIHSTKSGIKSCHSSPTPITHLYVHQLGSAPFGHSMGVTLTFNKSHPLMSIPDLPTWMVPHYLSIANALTTSTSYLPKLVGCTTMSKVAIRRGSNYADIFRRKRSPCLLPGPTVRPQ